MKSLQSHKVFSSAGLLFSASPLSCSERQPGKQHLSQANTQEQLPAFCLPAEPQQRRWAGVVTVSREAQVHGDMSQVPRGASTAVDFSRGVVQRAGSLPQLGGQQQSELNSAAAGETSSLLWAALPPCRAALPRGTASFPPSHLSKQVQPILCAAWWVRPS